MTPITGTLKDMKTIEVLVIENPTQVTNDPQNFVVTEKEYDEGSVVGTGSTQAKAIEDFEDNWMLRHGEEIETKIVTI